MPATYEPIATTTLGSATNVITFSSIPATYTDLRVIATYTTTAGGTQFQITFNSDTAANYSLTQLKGNGSAAASNRLSSQNFIYFAEWNDVASSTTIPTLGILDIFSYAGSTNKTLLGQGSNDQNGTGAVNRYVGLWRSTAAINTITFTTSTSTAKAGTTFTLYGIKAA